MNWNELRAAIDAHKTFLISSHLSLDGDCVGSQLAFHWYLTSLGKEVCLSNADPVPAKFLFLKNSDRIIQTRDAGRMFDVLMVLDCSNPGRLGWKEHDRVAKTIINIDHHRDNTRFGALNCIDTAAAATAEIIYRFFTSLSLEYPDYVAEALYAAIMTDTGGFRFSNTNSRILRTCADLADRGAECAQIYERIYASHPQRALLLQSRIWSSLQFHLDGKVCSMDLPLSVLSELGAVYSDSEGMADYTITASGVEVGILMKHTEHETHFSLRSKGHIDVGRIAQQIPGGGGHSSAAGCTLYMPQKEALRHMLGIFEKELSA
jgi:bifunctional oligoribonuclease and PAP phosphatase NrnA